MTRTSRWSLFPRVQLLQRRSKLRTWQTLDGAGLWRRPLRPNPITEASSLFLRPNSEGTWTILKFLSMLLCQCYGVQVLDFFLGDWVIVSVKTFLAPLRGNANLTPLAPLRGNANWTDTSSQFLNSVVPCYHSLWAAGSFCQLCCKCTLLI